MFRYCKSDKFTNNSFLRVQKNPESLSAPGVFLRLNTECTPDTHFIYDTRIILAMHYFDFAALHLSRGIRLINPSNNALVGVNSHQSSFVGFALLIA